MALRWYVVHAYSGFEAHVKRALTERIKLAGKEDQFGEILVPTEEVVEMKDGQKRKSERKFFPGYAWTDSAWSPIQVNFVRSTMGWTCRRSAAWRKFSSGPEHSSGQIKKPCYTWKMQAYAPTAESY